MDIRASALMLLCVASACFYLLRPKSRHRKQFLPGPCPLPIIGNILQLGSNPHRSLAKLAKTYGPLMHLKLGNKSTIVISSPEIATEILQKHDQSFPGRMTTIASRVLSHHETSVALLPIGNKWRVLRKICREQMFSTSRLDANWQLRHEKLQKLCDYVQDCCDKNLIIDIGEAAFVTSLNLISNTLFSINLAEYDMDSSHEFKKIVRRYMEILGTPNMGDYFPILGYFDLQGIKQEAEDYVKKLLAVFDSIIEQRMQSSSKSSPRKNDLLEALLETSRGNESELSRSDIKHLLQDLFVAGTDTTSNTVEWVMTELIRNPNVMSKAKKELKTIIGDNKQVEESDITKLPYLQAVIKETFRYHPSGPFLLRTKDEDELEIDKFLIPKNAAILINIWAIARDSRVWSNPDLFKPERFLNCEIDIKGHHFELTPFGAGRRICPGLPLAYRMIHLMVAYLIHNFDWKLEPGMIVEEMDIKERFGLSLKKVVPLKVVPVKL